MGARSPRGIQALIITPPNADIDSDATVTLARRASEKSDGCPANALWRCQASPNRCRVGEASRVLLARASG